MAKPILEKIGNRLRWGFFGAFIILLASYIITFYITQDLLKQSEWVNHTNIVINNLENVLNEIGDAETSVRGYFVIKEENFLEGFERTPKKIDSNIKVLRLVVMDNQSQASSLDTLAQLVSAKYKILEWGITAFKQNNLVISDSMIKKAKVGKLIMDKIREQVATMQDKEKRLLTERINKVTWFSNSIKIINIISLILAICLAFYSIIAFNKENMARKEADRKAMELRQQLEVRIGELNQLNSELVELKGIEKFAVTGRISRTIAHEVRNPLTNINLAAEHLRSEIEITPDVELLLEMITRNANRINQLISDLLNSTKATALNFVRVSVNDLLDSSLNFAADRIELNNIKVQKDYATGLKDILVDVQKINIAFLNIIVNAIESMKSQEGILILKTEDKNNKCVVTITDNGKGMDKEEVAKLFEPYFTTKENGTGLGLTNTQNIIISHKATILAESEIDKGTTFKISFSYNPDV